jgi:formate transporter
VVGGAELFTGNTLMVMALAARRVTLMEMLRAWVIVYAGNFVGAVGTAALVFLSGQYLIGDGSVASVAMKLGVAKVALPFDRALFLGILCNVLVCLAVWLSYAARSATDKVMVIVFPVSAFVVAGFEHSVANMYIIPLAMMIKAFAPAAVLAQLAGSVSGLDGLTVGGFVANLIPVTIGNIIGGGVLVGAVYWFVYLRERRL